MSTSDILIAQLRTMTQTRHRSAQEYPANDARQSFEPNNPHQSGQAYCQPTSLSSGGIESVSPRYAHEARSLNILSTMSIRTLFPPYKANALFAPPPMYKTPRLHKGVDKLLASLEGIDFDENDSVAVVYYLNAIKAVDNDLPARAPRSRMMAPVRAVAAALLGDSRPSEPVLTPGKRLAVIVIRARLARIVHRRMACLSLEGRIGSVNALGGWYRDVVRVLGWRDREEEELEWLWRKDIGSFLSQPYIWGCL